jgi:hypothetical protein
MDTKAAYDAILRAIAADPTRRLVETVFDEDVFGNFVVAYHEMGRVRTLVNDRGELVRDDPTGAALRVTVIPSIGDQDERSLLRALGLPVGFLLSPTGSAPQSDNDR